MKKGLFENIFYGLSIGCIISLFLKYNELSIENIYIFILLCLISFLISSINSRYSCSAYSGGLLCLFDFSLSYLKKVPVSSDISVIIFLVASLHLAEGVLVLFLGKKYSYKVIKKTQGGLLLGYIMKSTWVVPIIIAGMPLPLICILGYKVECYTTSRKDKKFELGLLLLLYSVTLLSLGLLSKNSHFFKVVGAVFMLLGHEGIKYMEECSDKRKFRKKIRG